MAILPQLLLSGLALGSIYGLVAIGFVLIYRASGLLNFAQGDIYMLGAFVGLLVVQQLELPFWVAFLVSIVVVGLVGMMIERLAFRRLEGRPGMGLLIASIGVSIIIQNSAIIIWGADYRPFPPLFASRTVALWGLRTSPQPLLILLLATLLILALTLFLRFTKSGRAMRAVAHDRLAASLMGIDVGRYTNFTFGLSAAVGAAGGIMAAPLFFVTPVMGSLIVIKAFTAGIIGGFDSIAGALLGGIILGVSENLIGGYVSSAYKDALAFILLLLVLLIRPSGLLGRARERVG